MPIDISNFGDALLSRPAGKEAFLLARAYILNDINPVDEIVLDFSSIKVMTPSWLDEFITGIKADHTNTLGFINTENPSVAASLKTVLA
ncbi:MAG: STAS-like domain-containing protein [Spirochaetaceae bacterium]|nr:STAS-like domain-containing protein [Spirochaetaceae bacterium]